jgi:DNA-binding transcriptional MerR regulator
MPKAGPTSLDAARIHRQTAEQSIMEGRDTSDGGGMLPMDREQPGLISRDALMDSEFDPDRAFEGSRISEDDGDQDSDVEVLSEGPPLVHTGISSLGAPQRTLFDQAAFDGEGLETPSVVEGHDGPSADHDTRFDLCSLNEDDPLLETEDDPRIPPGQMHFKIGEVARLTDVKPYVLRYWENEFPWIRPEKTGSKQRRYRREDVAMVLLIRRLRYDEQLTISRARELIRDARKQGTVSGLRPSRIWVPGGAALGATSPHDVATPVASGNAVDRNAVAIQLRRMRRAALDLLEAIDGGA